VSLVSFSTEEETISSLVSHEFGLIVDNLGDLAAGWKGLAAPVGAAEEASKEEPSYA
jgi:hypothetical protein